MCVRSLTDGASRGPLVRLFWAPWIYTSVFAMALTATSTAGALELGEAPPPIDLRDRDGRQADLGELVGRVVIVDFWASWCGPCKQEMPALQTLYEQYGRRGLVVIGVNIDRSAKKLKSFLKKTPVTFRIVHDRAARIASRYDLATVPSTFFIGRDGTLRFVHEGFRDEDADMMERRVLSLLNEAAERTRSAPKTDSKSAGDAMSRAIFIGVDSMLVDCALGRVSSWQ